MPWKESSVVEQRMLFICMWKSGQHTVAELARMFSISRKTAYKILKRWEENPDQCLADRPRRPKTSPRATPAEIRTRILEKRAQKPTWGPVTLLRALKDEGVGPLPAVSTVAGILKRSGLVAPRKKRQRATASESLIDATRPNEVWCTDFKGWFRVRTGQRCDPLTLMDSYSRYLLTCHGLFGSTRFEEVWEIYEQVFSKYGLPRYILSDNGAPFASTGLGGLSRLSVRWIKLGITPLRIVPGKPQQNGRLERFHRTLKQETATPPAMTPGAQLERFAAFTEEYNRQRPHQALGGLRPANCYTASERAYKGLPAEFDYPPDVEVRSVDSNGRIRWAGKRLSLSKTLSGEAVGLEISDESARARVWLGSYALCELDLVSGKTSPVARPVHLLWEANPGAPGGDRLEELRERRIVPVLPIGLE